MSVCPSCGAEGWIPDTPCRSCGETVKLRAPGLPELELDMPVAAPKPVAPKKTVEELKPLELAVDLNEMRHSSPPQAPRFPMPVPGGALAKPGGVSPSISVRPAYGAVSSNHPSVRPLEDEQQVEARTLADYGDPPKHWFMAPLYAYRVFMRQKELKRALLGRQVEAAEAAMAAEDALVACAERVRAKAGAVPAYKKALDDLVLAEDLLRSRDGALGKEQDAHAERIKSIDARIAKIDAELAAAQTDERRAAGELAEAELALQRAEAKLKRAEIEIRNAAVAPAPESEVRR